MFDPSYALLLLVAWAYVRLLLAIEWLMGVIWTRLVIWAAFKESVFVYLIVIYAVLPLLGRLRRWLHRLLD